jgi:DNA helicase-2/ATP-dependent DNA helicase PcrA
MSDTSYLNELNDVQRRAVSHVNGPLMVIAGPGSGKTRVLTYRIAHLIHEGVRPSSILSLTFTNKAAKEMKERIEKVVGSDANRVWAGTFHSIFARILRVEAPKIGYPADFTIYDRDDSKSLVNDIVKRLKLDKKVYNASGLLSRISSAKSNLITPQRYEKNSELMDYDKLQKRPLTHEIYKRYVDRCLRAGAMDFDDLLLQMFKLLYQNPENVREKYQQLFKYVLVDEFQDTNYLQYSILKHLVEYKGSPFNVCIVGDDAQSIYSFRGATIENIFQFEDEFPDVTVYKLEQNYRSTEHIVEAANQVMRFNKKQIKKKIWTDQPGGNKIKLIKAISDAEEGRLISNAIIEYKNRHHLANRDIAILYRTNAQSRVFEEQLRRNNLTYRVFGGLSFYQRKEIKDMLGYIRLTINPRDDEALRRVINYPRRGIGKTTLDRIADYGTSNEMSFWHAMVEIGDQSRSRKQIKEFIQLINTFRQKAQMENAYETILFIANRTGIYEQLRADNSVEGVARLENLDALLDGVKDFVEEDEVIDDEYAQMDRSLAGYLQSVALLTDLDQDTQSDDYISLMTTHSAKGLEYPCVFVVGLEENLFPSFMSMGTPEQVEEERRLFYVAITRAEKHLALSYASSRYQYGQIRFNDPSRFLAELGEENIDSVEDRRAGSAADGKFPEPKKIGGLRKPRPLKTMPKVDVGSFKPSPANTITEGMSVLHLKFGKGRVVKIDGARDNRVATIEFSEIDDPTRRIMLRFAKLQIMD